MMILKHGRLNTEKNSSAVNKFHYFPDKNKKTVTAETSIQSKKSLKNSKSRTRYAEYNEKDETIDDQI